MTFDEPTNSWTRTCPQCNSTVFHKSRQKCQGAERLKTICTKCNRSNVGKRNALTDSCPICNETIAIPRASKNITDQLEQHASDHNITPCELWKIKHDIQEEPKCRCGCGKSPKWTNWWDGYNTFIDGHCARTWSSFDHETATKISEKRKASLRGKKSWCKGLTKETDDRVKTRGKSTSVGRLLAFKEGRITNYLKFTKQEIVELLKDNKNLILQEIKEYKNCTSSSIVVKCSSCNSKELISLAHARLDRCRKCNPLGSYIQHQIADWIENTLGLTTARNTRGLLADKRELDIFIPAQKLAIEINGVYWHSEFAVKSKTYHQEKTDLCRNVGIRLLHVFEDEWCHQRQIVETLIKNLTDTCSKKVLFKHCMVSKTTVKIAKDFLEENDIIGSCEFDNAWGVFYKDELIACTVTKNSADNAIEILRLCTKIDHAIDNVHFHLVNEIISHATKTGKLKLRFELDDRFGARSDQLVQLGFTHVGDSELKSWYTNGVHKINNQQNTSQKVYKIWCCKAKRFELDI